MARALIVGCGCRGQALGAALIDSGWQVRGTTRRRKRLGEIEAAGIEAVIADPDQAGTVLDQIADVTVIAYLMATARGDDGREAQAIHGERLEHLLERLVDSPVRGFAYELGGGAQLVRDAGERWRIPVSVIDADPADHDRWLPAANAAVTEILRQRD